MRPPPSTPWPTILHPQFPQVGANAWMAHSKLSKVRVVPATVTSKDLSYSFPHTHSGPCLRPPFEPSSSNTQKSCPSTGSETLKTGIEPMGPSNVPACP